MGFVVLYDTTELLCDVTAFVCDGSGGRSSQDNCRIAIIYKCMKDKICIVADLLQDIHELICCFCTDGQNVVAAVVESGAFYCVSLLVGQRIPHEDILECCGHVAVIPGVFKYPVVVVVGDIEYPCVPWHGEQRERI